MHSGASVAMEADIRNVFLNSETQIKKISLFLTAELYDGWLALFF